MHVREGATTQLIERLVVCFLYFPKNVFVLPAFLYYFFQSLIINYYFLLDFAFFLQVLVDLVRGALLVRSFLSLLELKLEFLQFKSQVVFDLQSVG